MWYSAKTILFVFALMSYIRFHQQPRELSKTVYMSHKAQNFLVTLTNPLASKLQIMLYIYSNKLVKNSKKFVVLIT